MVKIFTFLIATFFTVGLSAQIQLTAGTVVIDFDGSNAEAVNGPAQGNGVAASPASGQINSNAIIFTGFSDDAGFDFGDTETTGDFARGTTTGAVSTGGLYITTETPQNPLGTSTASGNILLVQPGGSDFTPGEMIIKAVNSTAFTIATIDLSADVCVRNDQGRNTAVSIAYSTDMGVTYIPVFALTSDAGTMNVQSPALICANSGNFTLPVNLAPGGELRVQVASDDAGGSGSRDEIALDNITFSNAILPVEMSYFRAAAQADEVNLTWETSMELNNDYFLVEHSTNGNEFEIIGEVAGSGTTNRSVEYGFTHENAPIGSNYYRLVQTDYDGTESVSNTVSVIVRKATGAAALLPTLTTDQATLSFVTPLPHTLRVDLIDLNGRSVQQRIAAEGDTETSFDLSALSSGLYLVRYRLNGEMQTLRLIRK